MLHYILQVVAFQLLFLIIYDVFLRKETFFNLNRVYLLSTSVLSLVIPFIKIERIKEVVAKDFVIRLPEVLIGEATKPASTIDPIIAMEAGINLEPNSMSIWNIILISGMCMAALFLIYKIVKLLLLVSNNPKRWSGNVVIVCLLNSTKAFSFFHYIFLGNRLSPKESATILEHEMIHINQKHSLDLLFFELLRIAFWFNPLVYMYQNRMATLHEYVADSKAVKGQNKQAYYDNLLTQVFETQQFSFVNPFFKQSLIKKRIVMLSKSKSRQINLIKYALLIPIVFTMLVYTSSYAQEHTITSSSEIEQQDTQELTDEELKEKLYQELVDMDKSGKSFKEILDFVMSGRRKYVQSKVQYFRFEVYMKYLSDQSIKRKSEDGSLTSQDFESEVKVLSKIRKTYKEYLAWKRTEDAKQIWEAGIKDGALRLFVEDINNLTSEEKKKQDIHLKQLKTDDKYHKLIVSDYNDSKIYDFGKEKDSFKYTNSDDIEIIEIKETEILDAYSEVPFSIIEETPTFASCDDLETNEERKKCMSDNISKHVAKNFNTKLADSLGLVGRQRINVIFKISKEGHVVGIKARASHPALEDEAERVVKNLPQMIPGKQKGKVVTVPYNLPIVFQVKGDPVQQDTTTIQEIEHLEDVKEKLKNEDEIPFVAIDKAPVAENCENETNLEAAKKCFSNYISKYVNRNFDLNMASKLGLKGKQRINVMFQIDKSGSIINTKARAAHPDLENEAKRVINSLPQFKPGEMNGKPVIVNYSLPIVFQVHEDVKENKKN
ncbi:M56 family metallopeptidase [Psychroserpens damuponensis]|uniref:M56 family metallopeptidase n=1 Tax=Psychroserpens damuponensis TaxID=943936 RepID=UPI0009FBB405|nr:M56 family metallopeptidase [Psychroserpens damuponensis]